ncbi:MAG: hypothetical protein Q9214_004708 [Letrouitia sp. 1 TL-2023]
MTRETLELTPAMTCGIRINCRINWPITGMDPRSGTRHFQPAPPPPAAPAPPPPPPPLVPPAPLSAIPPAPAAPPPHTDGTAHGSSTAASVSTKKRRTSTTGSRGVANLTPEQLAKKRANDRDAQRAIRERTKAQIESLERKIRELSSQQPYQELQNVVRQKDSVEAENADIKRRLASALAILQPLLTAQAGPGTAAHTHDVNSPIPLLRHSFRSEQHLHLSNLHSVAADPTEPPPVGFVQLAPSSFPTPTQRHRYPWP